MIAVSMVVRNEADRHLARTLSNVAKMPAQCFITDDCSDDDTPKICEDYGFTVRRNDRPQFWEHEGNFRQSHLEWMDQFLSPGDWVLALDADETVNRPGELNNLVESAEKVHCAAISMRLFEFWTETEYRVDGFWFGTVPPILYKWQPGGRIKDVPMGCGREPTYVHSCSKFQQTTVDLLHWGYLNPEDRVRKHKAYTERLGGHGHNNAHVNSIVTEPMLRTYDN